MGAPPRNVIVLACMDSSHFVGDPAQMDVPVAEFLSLDHATTLRDEVERRMHTPFTKAHMHSAARDGYLS